MNIKTLEICGIKSALHGMRNPMDSWAKGDSIQIGDTNLVAIGDNDADLSRRLQTAGEEHAKHLRMIIVWADIVAPRYWWNEFDTYRAGVEKISCSTMHKLMARHLEESDFESDCADGYTLSKVVELLNDQMDQYRDEENNVLKREYWRGIIQMLPQSYLQKRTVMMSYAALRKMYRQRQGHKLKEWETFRNWVEGLPYAWMITE